MEQNLKTPPEAGMPNQTETFFPAIQEMTDEENEQFFSRLQNLPPPEETAFFEEEEECEFVEQLLDDAPPKKANSKDKLFRPIRPLPFFKGIIPTAQKKYEDSPAKRKAYAFTAGFLLCLVLFILLTAILATYIIVSAALLFCALLVLCVCAILIAIAIAGLCYGIVQLFTNGVWVGLIEIGLALTVSGVILALTALAGELSTGQLPRLLRFLTRCFVYCFLSMIAFVFGSERFLPADGKEVNQ